MQSTVHPVPRQAEPATGPLVTAALATEADVEAAVGVMREVLDADLGGYQARWHTDLDDLRATYLTPPGRALFVAHGTDGALGTSAIVPCTLASPPNPDWLATEYNRPDTCQLVRVWVSPRARRQGVARALVRAAVGWAVGPGGYRRVYLHTDSGVPGAEAFWRAMPSTVVHDGRPDPFNCVHFELDTEALTQPSGC